MIRFRAALTIASVSSLLVVASLGAAEARDLKVVKRTAPIVAVTTSAKVADAKVLAAVKPVEAAPTVVSAIVNVPACARKVKVIYAGYGEADRATCTVSATNTASATVVASR